MQVKTRDEIAREEITRDPIFLLQSGRIVVTDTKTVDWCPGCELYFRSGFIDSHNCGRSLEGALSPSDLVCHGYAEMVWHTQGVFLTREEGEVCGEQKSHHYPDGWRVYCVPAEGELVELLKTAVAMSTAV